MNLQYDDIEKYLAEQDSLYKEIEKLDLACKKKNQFIGRYVRNGFTDRVCLYIIVDETPRKYLLRFAWGESPNPYWGREIKLFKKKVEEMVLGRDYLEEIFSRRD